MTLGLSDVLERARKRQDIVKGRATGLKLTITPVWTGAETSPVFTGALPRTSEEGDLKERFRAGRALLDGTFGRLEAGNVFFKKKKSIKSLKRFSYKSQVGKISQLARQGETGTSGRSHPVLSSNLITCSVTEGVSTSLRAAMSHESNSVEISAGYIRNDWLSFGTCPT